MSRTGWSWLSCCLALALAPGEPFLDLSYEQALARSKDEGKLLLVDATASWCPPCKRMEKETWPADSVRTWLTAHAVPIQIDVDAQPELAKSLKIEAMPTVIAFKDGAEFDRIVGFKDPEALLVWLDGVAAGKRATQAVREKAAELESSTDVDARYDLARELLQQGDHERALKEYLWLWPNTRGVSAYGGVRLSFMLGDIRQLCDAHEPARKAFTEIVDELDTKVVQGQATDFHDWMEWLSLSHYLEDDRRVLAFHASHRQADGQLELGGMSDYFGDFVTAQIFDVLMEHEQFVDAAHLVPDLEAKARSVVAKSRSDGERNAKVFADNEGMLASLQEYERHSLTQTLARLHAAALAVDRREQAQAIGALLIAEFDDADSRIALVKSALATGRAGAEHRQWLDEAEQRGAAVDGWREKLPPLDDGPPTPTLAPDPTPAPAAGTAAPRPDDGG